MAISTLVERVVMLDLGIKQGFCLETLEDLSPFQEAGHVSCF